MTTGDPILFISHKPSQCGVYEFGLEIATALQSSRKYSFHLAECGGPEDYESAIARLKPAAVVCNFHPATTPWLSRRLVRRQHVPHIGIIHEITQRIADLADSRVFDFHVAADPTLLLRNPIVYKTGRLIPRYENVHPTPAVPTIGSFGFGTPGKGFEALVIRTQAEFDRAIIRLHIPHATFYDPSGDSARKIADRCRQLIAKPGITLHISHDFLTTPQLLDFLAQNSLNAFFYEKLDGRGISSALDLALAVARPLAITKSSMFRHLWDARPSITIEDTSLRDIIRHETTPLISYTREWTAQNLVWDYERIVSSVLKVAGAKRSRGFDSLGGGPRAPSGRLFRWAAETLSEATSSLASETSPVLHEAERRLRASRSGKRLVQLVQRHPTMMSAVAAVRSRSLGIARARSLSTAGDWVPPTVADDVAPRRSRGLEVYVPIPFVKGFNRILDDSARELYAPTIEHLYRQVPELMARKIPEANVQQAFVLDTVLRNVRDTEDASLLCVGSYEDTAAACVALCGLALDEIDPVVNYDLATYMTRPSCKKASYQVVFATSVLEHVSDDEQFLRDVEALLAPGGVGILTCDFNDSYRHGDRIPGADLRFYTSRDLRERLLSSIPCCELVDTPEWTNTEPDFVHDGCRYTFASLVFRKVR